jgi:N utilization substance protein B
MSLAVARTMARRSAVQAIYQWQVSRVDLSEVERQFIEEHGLGKADPEYFNELLHKVPAKLDVIDAALAEFTDRTVAEIDPVERAVLRISGYELLFRPDIPYRVVVNEGINLAKAYGAQDGHKYVNGILDKVAHKHRKLEVESYKAGKL